MQRPQAIIFGKSFVILSSLVETKMVDFNHVFLKFLIDTKNFKITY